MQSLTFNKFYPMNIFVSRILKLSLKELVTRILFLIWNAVANAILNEMLKHKLKKSFQLIILNFSLSILAYDSYRALISLLTNPKRQKGVYVVFVFLLMCKYRDIMHVPIACVCIEMCKRVNIFKYLCRTNYLFYSS